MTDPTAELKLLATRTLDGGDGGPCRYVSIPALEEAGLAAVSRLPVSLRIVLESVLRNAGSNRIDDGHIRRLAQWRPDGAREDEVPFTIGRAVLNCAAGIPLLGDLTAIRAAVVRAGLPAETIEPAIPLDMALDHTLTVDFHGTPDALARNVALDYQRNAERYRFVKWAVGAYAGIRLFPPGAGILHQLNLEHLAPGLLRRDGWCFPDTLVGTDSHTCMIAGLGTVGWGVGGIEAQAAVLGLPVYFLTPDVVGVHVTGALGDGVTSTDLVLHVTEMLRGADVVGKFVEFFGLGVARLTVPDRATIANMAPEYGATIGYFPVDEQTCRYLRQTGRDEARVRAVEAYYRAQGLFGAPSAGDVDYSATLALDLAAIVPSVAGPKRPQDRIALPDLARRFHELLKAPVEAGGYGRTAPPDDIAEARRRPRDGDVVIAAITSCTNTSNPGVMLAAGLVAKKAVERGLSVRPWVKTSLTPGSRVVSRYLEATGLQHFLDALGFAVAGYSCATCVGASGPIAPDLELAIRERDVVAAAVLSGNRNFEARIHPAVRAAFLASPPLVVAFALAGRVDIDLAHEPLGEGSDGAPVYLADVWPDADELAEALRIADDAAFYRELYDDVARHTDANWAEIAATDGPLYPFEPASTYLREPPFVDAPFRRSVLVDVVGARALAVLGNSVTTDHISPIGNIRRESPAGAWLTQHGVDPADYNNYGARRMNHEVMVRGAFSNVRLRNRLAPGTEGGVTRHQPDGDETTIYDAAMRYGAEDVPLVIVAGREYGTGSARDWAAKATRLLGVRAVIAESFERIHRANLVGLGVLPLQLAPGVTADALALDGSETFSVRGLDDNVRPRQALTLEIARADGAVQRMPVTLRLDTEAEIEYARAGGIMPYIFTKIAGEAASANSRA